VKQKYSSICSQRLIVLKRLSKCFHLIVLSVTQNWNLQASQITVILLQVTYKNKLLINISIERRRMILTGNVVRMIRSAYNILVRKT
jgi:hypothetical protein